MQPQATYSVRVLTELDRGPGVWKSLRVGVFRQSRGAEEQIGEYERNYPNLFNTFVPFRVENCDLALYSPDYTCTRILELPSCRDIGGEQPSPGGFCPVDYFVPYYLDVEYRVDGRPPKRLRRQMPSSEDEVAQSNTVAFPPLSGQGRRTEVHHRQPAGRITYHPFGFVAGCVWGDDSSWKLEYLDLSRASEGLIERSARFGYVEMPDGVSLAEAIDLTDYQPDSAEDYGHHVRITHTALFDLRDGRKIEALE